MATAKNNKYGYDVGFNRSGTDFRKNYSPTFGPDNVLNAVIGRLSDQLWYDSSYGIDLLAKFRETQPQDYNQLESEIEAEIAKEPRVSLARAEIQGPDSNNNIDISIKIRLSTKETFELIATINNLDSLDFQTI